MKSKLNRFSLCFATLAFISSHSLFGATAIWDTDAATGGAQDGNGTWTANGNNFLVGAANTNPIKGTDVIQFGNTTGGHTVTISNGGQVLNYSDSTSNSSVNFNRSYTLAGDGLAAGSINVNNGSTVNISASITGGIYTSAAVGSKMWTLANGSTLNLSGGGSIQGMQATGTAASVVNIDAGTWNVGGFNADGTRASNANMGGGGSEARNLTINQDAGVVINGTAGNFNIGGNAGSNAATITTYNLDGGTINAGAMGISLGAGSGGTVGSLSQSILNLNSGSISTTSELRVGNDGGGGTLNVKGGTLTSTGKTVLARRGNTGGAVNAAINITGGVTKMGQIEFGATGQSFSAGSTAALNLRGGSLYLSTGTGILVAGSAPITNLQTSINLSGGTLGATNNWSTAMNINLSNADGGVTIKTADDAGTGRNITFNGNLVGTGPLTVNGGSGILYINGSASTFTGGTFVMSGALMTSATLPSESYSSLGFGDVTVGADSILSLQNAQSISDTAAVYFNRFALIGLSYVGVETVGSITITGLTGGTSVTLGAGDYDAVYFAQNYGMDVIDGGILRVIPEPTSSALVALGALGVISTRRRRIA